MAYKNPKYVIIKRIAAPTLGSIACSAWVIMKCTKSNRKTGNEYSFDLLMMNPETHIHSRSQCNRLKLPKIVVVFVGIDIELEDRGSRPWRAGFDMHGCRLVVV
jgi:hypothetical protein